MKFVAVLLFTFFIPIFSFGQNGHVYTIAGTGGFGHAGDGGPAINALFGRPEGMCMDGSGNLYIADAETWYVRKIDAITGMISTIAGNGLPTVSGDGGLAIFAGIGTVDDLWVDLQGNVYLADGGACYIRKIDAVTGIITTIAGNGTWVTSGDGGPASLAGIPGPEMIHGDNEGNLYIVSGVLGWVAIRKIDLTTNIITTFAGGGQAGYSGDGGPVSNATIGSYHGDILTDDIGNIYYADPSNHVVRKIDVNGTITTVAGNNTIGFSGDGGSALNAQFNWPGGLALDLYGNLLIGDAQNQRIRKLDITTGIITTIAGGGTDTADGVLASNAWLGNTGYIYVDVQNNILVAGDLKVRMITSAAPYTTNNFSVYVNEQCNGPKFTVTTPQHIMGYSVKTYFGDAGRIYCTSRK